MLNAKVSITKDNHVGCNIHNVQKVNVTAVTAVTAEAAATGLIEKRKILCCKRAECERVLLAESIYPTAAECVEFFKVEDFKLIILGAMSVVAKDGALYLDCSNDETWIEPELRDGILTIRQAYSIRQTDNVLEVK